MDQIIKFIQFLAKRKKYWVLPIFIFILIFGGLIILSEGSVLAPFIYSVF